MPLNDNTPDPAKSDREPPNWWVLVVVAAVFAAGLGLSLYAFMKRQRQQAPVKNIGTQTSSVEAPHSWARRT